MSDPLPIHRYANIFPSMSQADFEGLMLDIMDNGQKEPIVLFDGEILDGRNRYDACRKLGIEPVFTHFRGTEEEAFHLAISRNIHRRHLTTEQRAAFAVELIDICREERLEVPRFARDAAPKKAEGVEPVKPGTTPPKGGIAGRFVEQPGGELRANLHENAGQRGRPASGNMSIPKAAETMKVSPRTVASAAKVKAKGAPELFQALKDGTVSVDAAAKVADLPKDQQQAILAGGPEAVQAAAAAQRKSSSGDERVEALISAVKVIARADEGTLQGAARILAGEVSLVRDLHRNTYELRCLTEAASKSGSQPAATGEAAKSNGSGFEAVTVPNVDGTGIVADVGKVVGDLRNV